MRLSPDETAYLINLTSKEAERIMELTKDSAKTVFETSVSCIGASVCQVGARDSQALLAACVEAVRNAKIPNAALPQIHIFLMQKKQEHIKICPCLSFFYDVFIVMTYILLQFHLMQIYLFYSIR